MVSNRLSLLHCGGAIGRTVEGLAGHCSGWGWVRAAAFAAEKQAIGGEKQRENIGNSPWK